MNYYYPEKNLLKFHIKEAKSDRLSLQDIVPMLHIIEVQIMEVLLYCYEIKIQ